EISVQARKFRLNPLCLGPVLQSFLSFGLILFQGSPVLHRFGLIELRAQLKHALQNVKRPLVNCVGIQIRGGLDLQFAELSTNVFDYVMRFFQGPKLWTTRSDLPTILKVALLATVTPSWN